MILWIDAQLSPSLTIWITEHFPNIEAFSVRYLGLRDAKDYDIFMAARLAQAIVITKDKDFVDLLSQHGLPPKIIWVTCGNTSNKRMREIFESNLLVALTLLEANEILVEIRDAAEVE